MTHFTTTNQIFKSDSSEYQLFSTVQGIDELFDCNFQNMSEGYSLIHLKSLTEYSMKASSV